jgi:hypothetical protein
MKKIIGTILLILPTIFPSDVFSQEENRIGLNLEMGTFGEYSKGSDGMGGRQFFVTPTYNVGTKTELGIGVGLKLFKYYKEASFVSAFPVYGHALYRFKSTGIRPFVEGKVGYTFLNDRREGKINPLPAFPWSSIYVTDSYAGKEYRTETKGGFFFSPSFGFLFPLKNKQFISASIAYGFDRTSVKTKIILPHELLKGSFSHHSIALRIGYVF